MLVSLSFLLGGLLTTLWITAAASALALAIALPVGVLRSAGGRGLRLTLGVYVEAFRGTSLLLQLFWLYYVLPLIGIDIPPATAAILGIGLNYGAYGSEVVRGAFAAVGRGQEEAARALGLRRPAVYRLVLAPQILPVVIAPLGVLAVQLLKATSLSSLITISDLSFRAYQLNQVTARTGPIFAIVLVLYFAASQAIAALAGWVDRSTGRWRRFERSRAA
jgi:polar amino acid transport system permease protein